MPALEPASVSKTTWSSEVYEPSDDSFALADAVLQQLPTLSLPAHPLCAEVGCGSGYVLCSLALALQQLALRPGLLLGTDINALALQATQQTLQAHEVAGVQLVQTDLLTALLPRLQHQLNLLVFNPPYVPTPDEEVSRPGIARAWAGGYKGRRVVDRFLAQMSQVVAVGGHVLIIVVPENDPADMCRIVAESGFTGRMVHHKKADEEYLMVLHMHRVSNEAIPYSA